MVWGAGVIPVLAALVVEIVRSLWNGPGEALKAATLLADAMAGMADIQQTKTA